MMVLSSLLRSTLGPPSLNRIAVAFLVCFDTGRCDPSFVLASDAGKAIRR